MSIPTFLGNLAGRDTGREVVARIPGKHRLVEECEIVRIEAVQRDFGKKALLEAIRRNEPFRVPVRGGDFDVWFVDVPHRLPGRVEQWSSREDGTVRLYLWCPGCQRKKMKLRYYFLPGGSGLSELWCDKCHDLAYQSVNCGGNRWWREIAQPLKRLLREKESLSVKLPSPRYEARIREIDNAIAVLRQKAEPKQRRRRQTRFRERRPYRDLSLIGGWINQPVARISRPGGHTTKLIAGPRTRSQSPKPVVPPKAPAATREPSGRASGLDLLQHVEWAMALELLPLAEKAVQEAERSPEWADNPQLARAKQGLERIRMLREQNGRTELKQRAGS